MSPQPRRATPAETARQTNPAAHPGTQPGERGQPRLLRIECWGLLDLALAVILFMQWRVMPLPPGSHARIHLPAGARELSVWGVVVLPLATWLILAAGALAPLSRRRAARPGDLPPGAGLWLLAYFLMAAGWFAILLNTFHQRFWGVAHLVNFDRNEAQVLALLIPAALAPGWRRLLRAARFRWLRQRRKRKPATAQIHPKFQISNFKAIMIALGLCASAWIMTDYAIMSDGFGILHYVSENRPLGPNQYREPGTLLALKGAAMALRPLGLDTAQAVHFANFLAMAGVLGLLGYAMRLMDLNRAQCAIGWWLGLSSLGITQMLLGRIELYPLVELSVAATVVFGLALLAGRLSPGWMCAAFSLGLAGHLSLIFLLPAVLLTLWFWTNRRRADNGTGHARQAWPRALAHLIGWGAAVHLPLWGWLMTKLPDPTPAGLVRAVTGSLNTGGKGIIEASLGQYTWAAKLERLASWVTIINPFQVLFYLAGGALLVGVLVLFVILSRNPHLNPYHGDPRRRRQLAILGAAFAGYLAYAYAWPNDWPWAEDWDLFSGITPLAVLLVLRWMMPGRGEWLAPAALARRVCWFALLLSLSQNFYYHRYASFLTALGKVAMNPENGRQIQQYQLDHGWKRWHNYVVRDGKVVLEGFEDAAK